MPTLFSSRLVLCVLLLQAESSSEKEAWLAALAPFIDMDNTRPLPVPAHYKRIILMCLDFVVQHGA